MILFIYTNIRQLKNESVFLLVVRMPDTKAGRSHWIRIMASAFYTTTMKISVFSIVCILLLYKEVRWNETNPRGDKTDRRSGRK